MTNEFGYAINLKNTTYRLIASKRFNDKTFKLLQKVCSTKHLWVNKKKHNEICDLKREKWITMKHLFIDYTAESKNESTEKKI